MEKERREDPDRRYNDKDQTEKEMEKFHIDKVNTNTEKGYTERRRKYTWTKKVTQIVMIKTHR